MASTNARFRSLRLLARVHGDAFGYDPAGYLRALMWRMRGLRVRSRNRIAALAGRSPHAYALWMARREPALLEAAPRADPALIQPLVDCRESSVGLTKTLESLAASRGTLAPIILGGNAEAEGRRASNWYGVGGLLRAEGSWICPLLPGDVIAPNAFEIYAAAIGQNPTAHMIYSDDDLIAPDEPRSDPHFKPDWNPELFEHHDFVTGAAVVRIRPGDLMAMPPEAGAGELIRCAIGEHPPVHLPLVLHHRRSRPEPVVPSAAAPAQTREPMVSVIVPTRNKAHLLRKCMEGLRETAYGRLEIVVVDNGSDEPDAADYLQELKREGVTVLQIGGPFNFSALNNSAVGQTRGEILCFLNNDVEMLAPDWLSLLVEPAMRKDLGAVGAKLLYPDLTIQHAGVFIGIGGGAGHGHRYLQAAERGYFHRANLPQRVSAVTGACLVVAREKFLAVKGFDETDFPVAFNDVDLCLKLKASGWESFYEPRATLIHHESKSRGRDSARGNRDRFKGELAALKRKWSTDQHHDEYHHPQLSPFTEQFLIAV